MKIAVTKEMKKILTVYEMQCAKRMMDELKEDSLEEHIRTACCIILEKSYFIDFKIYDAKACLARNARVQNAYTDDSGKLDVWIEFKAFDPYYGFFDCGVYLTDIWSIDGENNAEVRSHMYIQEYKKV